MQKKIISQTFIICEKNETTILEIGMPLNIHIYMYIFIFIYLNLLINNQCRGSSRWIFFLCVSIST